MAFSPVERTLDLPGLEQRVLARWREAEVFGASLRKRAGAPRWVFYEGPPTANGRPGLHHVLARSFKDLFPRFQTMRGKLVERKAGWDCHGLPVEVEVEKELGFSGKPMIEDFGIEAFNQRCRESVHRYVEDWSALTSRIGMWLDTSDAYWTLSNDYIESVWWLFHELWDRSLLYEGVKVVPYCGRCGTALSSHELGQPGAYQDVTEPSVYVHFPVVDADFDLLVWTTTPWTLVSNVGAAVGPDIEYVRVRGTDGRRDLVLAASRVSAVLGEDAEVVGPVPVTDLVGRHYERPFDFLPSPGPGPGGRDVDPFRVVAADFVTLDDGAGIVHLAPAFGEIDREVGEAEGLGMLNPVGPAARFDDSVPAPFAGQFVKDADPALIDALAASGRLERVVDYTHSYPHCWRCSTPLIYWAKPEWFARTSAHKDELLRENDRIGWHPDHIRTGRFGDWLENNVDWALSRDRFWGTPLPVWRCTDCGHDVCFGSVADLGAAAGRDLSDLDLHRPFVDDIRIECAACGGGAYRVEPVLDAWFDSGSMPAAQLHYPFEARDEFAARFPADFICEAIDQTRGWFYSLLAVNTLVFGRSPYRNVVCLGLIVSGDGQKMSKSRGNVTDPWSIIDARGADALRWYLFSAGSPWSTRRVSEEGIDEAARRFLLTLWNTYSFFVTYAQLDGWEPGGETTPVHVMDRWVRSRLAATVDEVTDALEGFDALRAAQALESFVDELSNWYVRRSRPRFWKAADPVAHATLHHCLATVAQVLAPFCPFTADEMWANLTGSDESVHLTDWPAAATPARDEDLEREMAVARAIVSLGRAARVESRIETRQPLSRALVLLPSGVTIGPAVVAEIADELNVKALEPVTSLEGLLDYTVVPNFRVLGARLRDRIPAVKAALATVDGAAVQAALDRDGAFVLQLDDGAVELGPDDVEVRAQNHEELALARDASIAVALDLRLDDALRREGTARKIVRALNDHRKTIGLEIADRIRVELATRAPVLDAVTEHRDWIAGEVLAVDLVVVELGDDDPALGYDPLEVDDTPVGVRIDKT